MASDFLQELEWRGQIHQCTDRAGLERYLGEGAPADKRAYVGFDPTADSLTIGNLVGIMTLARWQRAGHTPIALMGGATGLIGDPSGKSAERTLNTKETVAANVERIRTIFEGGELFDDGASNRLRIVNNIDWLGKLSYLDALRDIGKHFSVNMMMQKDSVKARLESREQGISYTEFSYMILQAYDFAHLFRAEGVAVQMGGSDQFGNIVVGGDLIRKFAGEDSGATRAAFGVTWPLVTKADGTKFGKTESGAIWLKADRTSPYAYYQFWLNASDADVVRFLKTFTFLSREEIAGLEESLRTNPGAREAQRTLAFEATRILHGTREAEGAKAAAGALFSGDVASLPERTLREVFASAPTSQHARAQLEGEGVDLHDLLVAAGLASSKREAKEFLAGGSVTINGRKPAADARLRTGDLLHGSMIAIRRGKKVWHLTVWG